MRPGLVAVCSLPECGENRGRWEDPPPVLGAEISEAAVESVCSEHSKVIYF